MIYPFFVQYGQTCNLNIPPILLFIFQYNFIFVYV